MVRCNVLHDVCKTFLGVHRFTSLLHHKPTLSGPKTNVAATLLQPQFVRWVRTGTIIYTTVIVRDYMVALAIVIFLSVFVVIRTEFLYQQYV